jgi:hypothetical protein
MMKIIITTVLLFYFGVIVRQIKHFFIFLKTNTKAILVKLNRADINIQQFELRL